MLQLAAFADEISSDLDEQIAVCRQTGVAHFELRGVDKINVLDFDPSLRQRIRQSLRAAGLGVVSIGSPIGKVAITDPWSEHFERFKIAVDAAEYFNAPFIRIFSYYPPPKGDIHDHREEVMRRMRVKLDYIQGRPVILIHENEARIFGESIRDCVDLMQTLDHPQFRFAFDFANFVQAGQNPLEGWPSLKPYTVHIHIKDALAATGKVVPAGQGDGHLTQILRDAYASGYRGMLSLEPHLAAAGQFNGFSGPELFKTAVAALRDVCRAADVPIVTG